MLTNLHIVYAHFLATELNSCNRAYRSQGLKYLYLTLYRKRLLTPDAVMQLKQSWYHSEGELEVWCFHCFCDLAQVI